MGTNSAAATAIQKKEMIDALEANFGNVTESAKMVGITPRTHYRWLKEDREYADVAENMKDVCFRRVKDKLLEKALTMIDKGDSAVLNRMMAIYFKNVPQEILIASRHNNVPLRATIKYVSVPPDRFAREEGVEEME